MGQVVTDSRRDDRAHGSVPVNRVDTMQVQLRQMGGIIMVCYSVRSALGVGFGVAAMGIFVAAGGGTAVADTPTGTCTNSYAPYTYDQLSAIDPGLTPALFSLIDTNGNGVICFKAYPNGPHNGHAGNVVDDKAAPHT